MNKKIYKMVGRVVFPMLLFLLGSVSCQQTKKREHG